MEGELFNSLCSTQESQQWPRKLNYKHFTWNSVELQEMVTLQLQNITSSRVRLERILTWQSLKQHNVWFYKTPKYNRLTNLQQHYPYVPRKSEIEKERKTKWKIKDITTLGFSDGLCWWSGSFIARFRKPGCLVISHQSSTPTYNHIACCTVKNVSTAY